jgi:hypothetical protein
LGHPFHRAFRLTQALTLAATTLLAACQGERSLGGILAASEDDYDECGNGMDDDGDGLIDELCFCGTGETQACFDGTYPHRRVGVCADGVQACDAVGSVEFGHWTTCAEAVTPAEEACDGSLDEDCDGAIDEGCACTAGESRPCGETFLLPPCSTGTQTCQASGTWSTCEGAVGPGPELCSDRIDNDCDGEINEGCGCVPEPEVCSDGMDNDCDGRTDEPPCTGPMVCTPRPEACGDLLDNDCDGDIDEGCDAVSCDCTWRASAPVEIPSGGRGVAWDSDAELGLVDQQGGGLEPDGLLRFGRVDLAGSVRQAPTFRLPLGKLPLVSGLAFSGPRWVTAWWDWGATETRDDRAMVVSLDHDGALQYGPVRLGDPSLVSRSPGILVVGTEVHVAYYQRTDATAGSEELFYQVLSPELLPLGPPVRLTHDSFFDGGNPPSLAYDLESGDLGILHGSSGAVTGRVVRDGLGIVSHVFENVPGTVRYALAAARGEYLACWDHPRLRCWRFDSSSFIGSAFDVLSAVPDSFTVTWTGCEYAVTYSDDGSHFLVPISESGPDIGRRINLPGTGVTSIERVIRIDDRLVRVYDRSTGWGSPAILETLECR